MRRLCVLLALLAAGCATPVQGPVGNTGTIVGEPTAPRNRARIHTELATLYYARGNMSVALEELRTAVAADPTYATAHGMIGLVYKELRENALAESSFQRALSPRLRIGCSDRSRRCLSSLGGRRRIDQCRVWKAFHAQDSETTKEK
jgi:Tfp pilus assembly protein PilF